MSPRDLYFVVNHQAAQAVVAVTLGYRVDHIDVALEANGVGWELDTASVSDIGTICAAGFAMERLLGRVHDLALKKSASDLAAFGTFVADRTGIALDPRSLEAEFLAGASSSEAIISHPTARKAIDDLATSLSELQAEGGTRLSGPQVYLTAATSK